MAATIVDWAALGKVIGYSFAATLVLTVLFTTGVLRTGERGVAARAIGAAAFAGCAGLVLLGLYVMFASK
jgi:hypothetical protein